MMKNDLTLFREQHKLKSLLVKDNEWRYFCVGKGDNTIVILPGGLGTGEAAFHYIKYFENHYNVIAPIYPDLYTMDELVEGLKKIIDHEAVTNINLFGISFGGLLAQCYMKKYSKEINNLILAHTTTVTSDYPSDESNKRISSLKKAIKIIDILPLFLLKIMYNKKFKKISEQIVVEEEFWEQYFKELIKDYDKNSFKSSMTRMIDFVTNYKFEYDFLEGWDGKVLILEADDDKSFSHKEKEYIKKLYKDAEVHTEHGFGHLTTFVKRDLYMQYINEFIVKHGSCTSNVLLKEKIK